MRTYNITHEYYFHEAWYILLLVLLYHWKWKVPILGADSALTAMTLSTY